MKVERMLKKYKNKILRVWEKEHTEDECFFETLRNWYYLPNKDILLEFSNNKKHYSYELLSKIVLAYSKKDNEN